MNGSIPCFSFCFFRVDSAKVIISGDTDQPLPLKNSLLELTNTFVFHDMGSTGYKLPEHIFKAHPAEEEVFEIIGPSDRVFGIHISNNVHLSFYEKAKTQIYNF